MLEANPAAVAEKAGPLQHVVELADIAGKTVSAKRVESVVGQAAAVRAAESLENAIGQQRNFGDWAVGCDNGWTCEAISLTSEDWSIGSGISLTVRRAGGSDGYNKPGILYLSHRAPKCN